MAKVIPEERICLLRVRKRTIIGLLGAISSTLLAVGIGEAGLRFLYPQDTLCPRWQYSTQYSTAPSAGAWMVQLMPGRWRYHHEVITYARRSEVVVAPDGDAKCI